MIAHLQILMHIPILSIEVPGVAMMMLKILIPIVNFEFLNLLPFYDGVLDWLSGNNEIKSE